MRDTNDSNLPIYHSISRDAPPDLMHAVAMMLDTYCAWLNAWQHDGIADADYQNVPQVWMDPPHGDSSIRAIYTTSDHWVLALRTYDGDDGGSSTITGYWYEAATWDLTTPSHPIMIRTHYIFEHMTQEFDTTLQLILTEGKLVNPPDQEITP